MLGALAAPGISALLDGSDAHRGILGLAGSMALRLELFAGGSQGFKIQ